MSYQKSPSLPSLITLSVSFVSFVLPLKSKQLYSRKKKKKSEQLGACDEVTIDAYNNNKIKMDKKELMRASVRTQIQWACWNWPCQCTREIGKRWRQPRADICSCLVLVPHDDDALNHPCTLSIADDHN